MNVPEYRGEPLSAMSRITQEDAPAHLWHYTYKLTPLPGTLDTINRLTEQGYEQVDGESDVEKGHLIACLVSQLHDVVGVQDGERVNVWAHHKSIEYVKKHPVLLCFTLQDENHPDTPHIPMLQFLPLPRLGEYAVIGIQDATLYNVYDLDETSQQLQPEMGQTILDLAGESKWGNYTEVHALCAPELKYLGIRADLHTDILSLKGMQQQEAKDNLAKLEKAHHEVVTLRQSWLRPDWLHQWQEIRRMAQELAASYYDHHEKKQQQISYIPSLPSLTTSHQTKFPSNDYTRALGQGFGSRVARSLWNTEQSTEQILQAPNGALLATRGENDPEQKALHKLIEGGMGTEGIKYMVTLMAAYEVQTGAQDRKIDARVTLRQLLQFMGRGDHADDLDEQRKLMHYILYLSRTWVTTLVVPTNRPRRRGRPPKAYHEASPLIVLEALKSDERGGLRIPEAVEFHLGKEYWEQMFGSHRRFFTIPTALILQYDSKRQSHEISLAFYLSNMINLNGSEFEIHFPTLLIQTGLLDQEDIDHSEHRMRDALRIIYALEKLEQDLLITREPHPKIDTALASEFYAGGEKGKGLSPATLTRIENSYRHFQALTPAELRTKKRVSLQSLLEQVKYNAIKFKPGPLIIPQIAKRNQGRQAAIEQREKAQEAAQKRGRKRTK